MRIPLQSLKLCNTCRKSKLFDDEEGDEETGVTARTETVVRKRQRPGVRKRKRKGTVAISLHGLFFF